MMRHVRRRMQDGGWRVVSRTVEEYHEDFEEQDGRAAATDNRGGGVISCVVVSLQ
jgi:hypothetical protein